jgi:hypothetical protein
MAPQWFTHAFTLLHVNGTVYLLLLLILHQAGLPVVLSISPSSKIGPERFAWKIDMLWNMENAICSETWKIRFADKIIRGSSKSIAIWVISEWILNVSIFSKWRAVWKFPTRRFVAESGQYKCSFKLFPAESVKHWRIENRIWRLTKQISGCHGGKKVL